MLYYTEAKRAEYMGKEEKVLLSSLSSTYCYCFFLNKCYYISWLAEAVLLAGVK